MVKKVINKKAYLLIAECDGLNLKDYRNGTENN